MADGSVLRYRSGDSGLHRLDVRCKLAGFGLINILGLRAEPMGLLLVSGFVVFIGFHLRLPIKSICWELRWFFCLLALVLVTRAFSTPGHSFCAWRTLTVTWEGLEAGLLFGWRLTIVVLLSIGLVVSTRPADIKAGVQWFLAPWPLIPEKRLAIMFSLMVRFLPLILSEGQTISEAQRARGVDNRKNPWYRMVVFGLPFLARIFRLADRVVEAMEARCYSDERTDPLLSAGPRDIWTLVGLIVLAVAAAWL